MHHYMNCEAFSTGGVGVPDEALELRCSRSDCPGKVINQPSAAAGLKRVPVLLDFDLAQPVGVLYIDESKLPKHASYSFQIGYRALIMHIDGKGNGAVDEHELLCVSLQQEKR